jgi:hypothetical protein
MASSESSGARLSFFGAKRQKRMFKVEAGLRAETAASGASAVLAKNEILQRFGAKRQKKETTESIAGPMVSIAISSPLEIAMARSYQRGLPFSSRNVNVS